MAQDQQTYRRATNAALAGLAVQTTLTFVLAIAGLESDSPAIRSATWAFLAGLPIWIVLALLFNQHRLERIEALEAEQLSRADAGTAAIFDEHGIDLQIASRRLKILYKWGLNGVSLGVAVCMLVAGGLNLYFKFFALSGQGINPFLHAIHPGASVGLVLCLSIAIAFIAFIVARYEAGMTRISEWQLLRGGASFLMGNFVMMALISAGLGFVLFDNVRVLGTMGMVIPVIMMLLGLEMLLSFVLGAYRPRRPGETPRPAFDSRILGLLTSPKSLAKALSDAINYQFGFEVSRSWFYTLLSQAITPLIAFGLVVLLLMSTIVIVQPHEKAVITSSGRISRIVGPGLHFKMPWPIGASENVPVGRLIPLSLGSASKGLSSTKAILWTNTHAEGTAEEKESYLVTAPTAMTSVNGVDEDEDTQTAKDKTPGTGLVGLQVVMQYRIVNDDNDKGILQYIKSASDPDELLRCIVERRLSQYLVTQDIDSLVGPGAIEGGKLLQTQIQNDAEEQKLGLKIEYVGLAAAHPPSDGGVAASFQEQVNVLQDSQTEIEKAMRSKIETLARVAGSQEQAEKILKAIAELEALQNNVERSAGQPKEGKDGAPAKSRKQALIEKEAEIDDLLASAQGLAAEKIFEARAYRWERAMTEGAQADRFSAQLDSYKQAPSLYRNRRYLEVLAESMDKPRKYVLAGSSDLPPTIRMDFKDATSSLEGIMSEK
ncbi:MAG: SPFH domain-containing protein [Planctomycetota bacterium]|nr:SPFH domain-containing protein [Planctomycetota bacterium]